MAAGNKAVVFRQYCASGLPEPGVHFTVESLEEPAPIQDGEVLAKLLYVSVDPYLRGRMKDVASYFKGFTLGQPGDSGIVVEVVESKNPDYEVGSRLAGYGNWIERQVINAETLKTFWRTEPGLDASTALGVLGMPGATAYFGYLDICTPKEGETLVVSGAAGAVGSLVVQIGKIKGCRVIAIAGSDDKLAYLKSIGADVTINYKTTPDIQAAIREAAPSGVDQYFDNVGGYIKDAVFANLNSRGRVSSCGAISSYNELEAPLSKNWEWLIVTRQIKIEGFLVFRWRAEWPRAFQEMAGWIKEGKLTFQETRVQGLENTIVAFNQMMSGENTGKMVVVV